MSKERTCTECGKVIYYGFTCDGACADVMFRRCMRTALITLAVLWVGIFLVMHWVVNL